MVVKPHKSWAVPVPVLQRVSPENLVASRPKHATSSSVLPQNQNHINFRTAQVVQIASAANSVFKMKEWCCEWIRIRWWSCPFFGFWSSFPRPLGGAQVAKANGNMIFRECYSANIYFKCLWSVEVPLYDRTGAFNLLINKNSDWNLRNDKVLTRLCNSAYEANISTSSNA